MIRIVPAALAALSLQPVLASSSSTTTATNHHHHQQHRQLVTPGGFGQVGQTLFGIPPTNATDEVEFGTAVALSSTDGTRLAVGAPFHDWSDPFSTDNANENENGGGLYLYDYNGTSWDFTFFMSGAPGEQLGDRFALSADGGRIAVRRYYVGAPDTVEVYDVDSLGAEVPVGGAMDCGDGGAALDMSSDGTRVVLGCENYGLNIGRAEVYDLVGGVWTQIFAVNGTNDSDFFGSSVSLSADGGRLAVSAPYASSDTGYVRVFDLSTSLQLGADLTGDAVNSQFGLSMEISGDGNTLVVGAPESSSNLGKVHIFEWNSGSGAWTPKADSPLTGDTTNGRFGRSVAISNDGSRIAASDFYYSAQRGRVQLMEVVAGAWTSVGEDIVGEDALGRLGYGILGVSMTSDGATVASGAVWENDDNANSVGSVRVLEVVPTSAPTAAPTSNAGTSSPTSPPTPSPTSPPTILSPFDWSIERLGNVTVSFDAASETEEIALSYNITLRDALVQIFEDDCLTPVPSTVAQVSSATTTPTSTTRGNLDVALDIKQDSVVGSGIWQDLGVGTGYIGICVRVDLVMPDNTTSVNFHEQKIFVSINLLQGFTVTDIDLDRIAADETADDADVDYGVTACQCNATEDCVSQVLNQGDSVYICVWTDAPNVEISDIRSLSFVQGALSVNSIVDGEEDDLTTYQVAGKTALIRSQLISAFFEDPDPEDVDCSGVALLEFVDDDGRRRNLRSAVPVRLLQAEEQDPTSSFDTTVQLAALENSGAFSGFPHVLSVMVLMVAGGLVQIF